MRFCAKNQERLPLSELRARDHFQQRERENSERTNQIRVFPIEHSSVSTNGPYSPHACLGSQPRYGLQYCGENILSFTRFQLGFRYSYFKIQTTRASQKQYLFNFCSVLSPAKNVSNSHHNIAERHSRPQIRLSILAGWAWSTRSKGFRGHMI